MTRFRIIYEHSNIEAPQGRFDIGRSLECNLVLDDPSVSRFHATIVRNGDTLKLEDRGSRNGCTLNGKQVQEVMDLKDGDVIGIGHQSVRISVIRESGYGGSNTMGLSTCDACGAWVSVKDAVCGKCGRPVRGPANRPSMTAQIDVSSQQRIKKQSENDLHSIQMLGGLARKAMSKNKPDEAYRLVMHLMESIVTNQQTDVPISERELEDVAGLLIQLGEQTREPRRIVELFAFFTQLGRLLPRKSVDQLYATAKSTGYRASPELHQYIQCLTEIADTFTPGDKFILRRIEGLAGLCS